MREFYFKLNCHFLDNEKEQCKQTVYRLVELANYARLYGLLSLEIEALQEQNLFLKTAITLVIDATEPVLIKQILQNLILADKYSGSELLSRLLIAEGILAIQQGEHPRTNALKLYSMLGEKYLLEADETFSATKEEVSIVNQFIKSIKDSSVIPESALFEKTILQMPDRSIQAVLYGIDEDNLVTALHGCSNTVIKRVFMSVSINTGLRLVEIWKSMKPLQNEIIHYYQNEILEKVETLIAKGEIIDNIFQNEI